MPDSATLVVAIAGAALAKLLHMIFTGRRSALLPDIDCTWDGTLGRLALHVHRSLTRSDSENLGRSE
jgi:hypothetical protein